jgi:hypothetical protein
MLLPRASQPSETSISSIRYSGATSTTPVTCGCSASRAISAPLDLYGEITRSAPARSSFFSESSTAARATMVMSERSSRAVRQMKMFSASESTHASTATARSIPAAFSISSSEGRPSRNGAPIWSASSLFSSSSSTTAKTTSDACRSRATCRPTRPKPQIRW